MKRYLLPLFAVFTGMFFYARRRKSNKSQNIYDYDQPTPMQSGTGGMPAPQP